MVIQQKVTDRYAIYNGDCIEVARQIPTDSIHYSISSIPFASLYTYSNSERDLGNCKTYSEFREHFQFMIEEWVRVTMPGRLISIHCMNLPTSKQHHGYIGLQDFRGDIIRMFCGGESATLHEARTILWRMGRDTAEIDMAIQDASIRNGGMIYHSEVCIWKDPVIAMQRTKALGLLHKQIKKDSAMSRQGIPDYLVTFRKPDANPEPISHTAESFPVSIWQHYADPCWVTTNQVEPDGFYKLTMDINPSETLQRESAREEKDERHICPLQLKVIERGINLWSNPGDTIYDPFGGIGSTGYVALKNGRRTIMSELKESYYKQNVLNCESALSASHGDLFGSAA